MRTIIITSSGWSLMKIVGEMLQILPKKRPLEVAFITTASKTLKDKLPIGQDQIVMEEFGFHVVHYDLEKKTKDEVREFLNNKDVIYIEDGSAFYLLKMVRESGFDKLLPEFLDKGVIFIGRGEGNYILSPIMHIPAWSKEDIEQFGNQVKGVNLIPFLVKTHYTKKHEQELLEEMKLSKYPIVPLTDEEALIIRDNKVEYLGEPSRKLNLTVN